MERSELQLAADYIVTLESRLNSSSERIRWGMRELQRLQKPIEDLQDASVDSHDFCEKAFLRRLQYIAQRCRESLLQKQSRRMNSDPEWILSHPPLSTTA